MSRGLKPPVCRVCKPWTSVRGSSAKWHLGNEVIRQHGFDEWVSIEDYYRTYYSDPKHLSVLSDYHRFLIGKGIEPRPRVRRSDGVFP